MTRIPGGLKRTNAIGVYEKDTESHSVGKG